MLNIEINKVKCQFCLRVGCVEHSKKDLIPAPFNKAFWTQYLRIEVRIWIKENDYDPNSGYKSPQMLDFTTFNPIRGDTLDLDKANQQFGTHKSFPFKHLKRG